MCSKTISALQVSEQSLASEPVKNELELGDRASGPAWGRNKGRSQERVRPLVTVLQLRSADQSREVLGGVGRAGV